MERNGTTLPFYLQLLPYVFNISSRHEPLHSRILCGKKLGYLNIIAFHMILNALNVLFYLVGYMSK
jgi:hypothetical protein